jgi:nitroreductase
MNVKDALLSRRSCRAFRPDPVPRQTILEILEAATHAPSWANTQPWEVYVAGGEALDRLRQAYLGEYMKEVKRHPDIAAPRTWPPALKQRIDELMKSRQEALAATGADPEGIKRMGESNIRFFDAPVVLYLCMDRSLSSWGMFDLGALAQSIMLAAEERKLCSIPAVMLAAFPEHVRAELGIPDHLAVVIGIALGQANPDHPLNRVRSLRRPIEDVVTFKGL